MDSDRKSTVSSFYGGPKSSLDALTHDFPPSQHTASSPHVASPSSRRERDRDDASSFFNPYPERGSMDHLNSGRMTPGYNRNTFFPAAREAPLKGGKDEEDVGDGGNEAWDVYADFNNAGPRYSAAFGTQNSQGYQQIPPTTPKFEDTPTPSGNVELVTVPALGPEWGREELKDMTKSARKKKKSDSRKEFWKQWYRGERGMCGRYFTRKIFVFVLFGLCAAIAIVIAITLPRVPSFAFNNQTPLVNASGSFADEIPTTFSRVPTNFSFPAFASLQLNTGDSFLPITFKSLKAQVFDLDTARLVATGDLGKKTVPAKSFPEIMLPLNFTYIASNDSDQTWLNWYNGCNNRILHQGGTRPPVKFRLVLDINILGLPSHHSASTQVSDADCPFELPVNSV